MAGVQDVNMVESLESKSNAIMNTLATLSRTLKKAISLAVKCDNHLFQCREDQRSKQHTIHHAPTMTATILNSHSETEDIQIDAIRVKSLIPEKKK